MFKKVLPMFIAVLLLLGCIPFPVLAGGCDATVTAPDSIQDAIDAAGWGDMVCLDDSGGSFSQVVVFDVDDSGITLTAENGDIPVLDGASLAGSGPTTVSAITLQDGVASVTIESLTIQNYEGDASGNDRSSAVVAWDVETSDIAVRDNKLLDNFWNGVLVGSEGSKIHSDWVVKNNLVEGNGFVGIELTNAEHSKIADNIVNSSGFAGIVVQARNTIPDSGLVTIEGVLVAGNTVSDSPRGIYVLALASEPVPPFDPITAAQSLLSGLNVKDNDISAISSEGIRILGFLGGEVRNSNFHHNTIDSDDFGIKVMGGVSFSVSGGASVDNNIHHNDVTSGGQFAVTLDADTSGNKVHHNSLTADVETGDDAVDDGGTNKVFKNS